MTYNYSIEFQNFYSNIVSIILILFLYQILKFEGNRPLFTLFLFMIKFLLWYGPCYVMVQDQNKFENHWYKTCSVPTSTK